MSMRAERYLSSKALEEKEGILKQSVHMSQLYTLHSTCKNSSILFSTPVIVWAAAAATTTTAATAAAAVLNTLAVICK